MASWLIVLIIVIAFALIVGNFNALHKNARQPMRKTGLNDLQETLPRSHKTAHQLPTVKSPPRQK